MRMTSECASGGVCVPCQSTAFTFAEMGFSKIESQHKSQRAKKRRTKYKSHTTPKKIADTLSGERLRACYIDH